MRILFVAKHGCGGGEDEDAITHALTTLSHEIIPLQEIQGYKANRFHADICLFLKWDDAKTLKRLNIPKVMWYFDLVEYPDPGLKTRNQTRIDWMARILPNIQLGFCTDGTWVEDYNGRCFGGTREGYQDKLVWLPQGADSRVVGRGMPLSQPQPPILFTGTKRGGTRRSHFYEAMVAQYGDRFHHVEKGVYGRHLADLIASSKVVIAPNAPVSNNYWSNRVYTSLGFGAFLLHPYCSELVKQYKDGQELITYHDLHDLFDKIDYYLDRPEERQQVAEAGLQRTLAEHTYFHRCQRLMEIVKERLF